MHLTKYKYSGGAKRIYEKFNVVGMYTGKILQRK
jgi:hypothetical protein